MNNGPVKGADGGKYEIAQRKNEWINHEQKGSHLVARTK